MAILKGAAIALIFVLVPCASSYAASFDCDRARTPDEVAICNHRDLNDMDVRMATLFEIAKSLVLMGERGEIQDDQREWLARRRLCRADVGCLRRSYRRRIEELETVLRGIQSRGLY
ncbi:MAG: hypothetical protein GC190_22165 [Alphaproteobacteria bacterium]|nr:hypothetical protein [Alphaproteobacteria bacterium]